MIETPIPLTDRPKARLWGGMDALSEILRAARLTGGVFLHGAFSEPWCIASAIRASDCSAQLGPADHLVLYHFVLEGRLVVRMRGGGEDVFLPGQAVVLPRNEPHELSGTASAEAVGALDVAQIPGPGELMVIEHGGGGAATRIVCGFLGGRGLAGDPLLAALPAFFRYDGRASASGAAVRATLALAAREVAEGRPGAEATLARISELLFVEAVRAHVEALPEGEGGWFEALRDRTLSRAIALLHRHPAERWTITRLGRSVGASRSTLAAKFVRHLGCPPAEYHAGLRMRLAARDLADGDAPIAGVAERVGYGSEAAFSRAFKRHFGVAPSVWRHTC